MASNTKPDVSNLPDVIRQAFYGRAALTLPEVAKVLEMDVKTLRKHVAAGDISFRIKGTGPSHVHRVFSILDVERFLSRPTDRRPLILGAPTYPGKRLGALHKRAKRIADRGNL